MSVAAEILYLAYRDFSFERRISLCYVLALTAVIAPLLTLFALKFGLIDTLAKRLLEAPSNREVVAVGSRRYDAGWFKRMAARPDVAFIVPSTRRIAASISRLKSPTSGEAIANIQMIPTAPGDPLFDSRLQPQGASQLLLSASAAAKLGLSRGGPLEARVDRVRNGNDEAVSWTVRATGVLRPEMLAEDAVLVPLDLLLATEDYRDGLEVSASVWAGRSMPRERTTFARFRLYAATLNDVETLESELRSEGIEVQSKIVEINAVRALDRNLSRVFWFIALISSLGFLASLAASLIANVERKRRELSILRLMGFPALSLTLYPAAQSVFIVVLGALAAFLIYMPSAMILNDWFAVNLQPGEAICRLQTHHILIALAACLSGAILAAVWAGRRAMRIEPAEGVRDV